VTILLLLPFVLASPGRPLDVQIQPGVEQSFTAALSVRYRLRANEREVGAGETGGLLLHASRVRILSLPVENDHGELAAAAGRALLAGGEVDARLRGALPIRLAGGDVPVPLSLSGSLSLSR